MIEVQFSKVEFSDKDVRRVARFVHRHETTKPAEPFRGRTDEWVVGRFAQLAYPLMVYHGYLGLADFEEGTP